MKKKQLINFLKMKYLAKVIYFDILMSLVSGKSPFSPSSLISDSDFHPVNLDFYSGQESNRRQFDVGATVDHGAGSFEKLSNPFEYQHQPTVQDFSQPTVQLSSPEISKLSNPFEFAAKREKTHQASNSGIGICISSCL